MLEYMIAKLFLRCALGPQAHDTTHSSISGTLPPPKRAITSSKAAIAATQSPSFASAMPLVNNAVAARSCISWVSLSPERAAVWWCRVDDADVNRFVVISSVEGYPPPGRRD